MMIRKLILLIGLIHQLNCESIKSQLDVELKDPIVKDLKSLEFENKQDEFWLQQFLYILFNYSTLLVPILSIVYLVKNNLCFLPVQRSKFIQIFVNGKISRSNDIELEHQLIEKSSDKKDDAQIGQKGNVTSNFNDILALIFCFAGLQISYLTWGVLQEKIMTTTYTLQQSSNISSHESIRFKDSQFLILINRVLAFAFATITLVFSNLKKRWSNRSDYVPKTKKKCYIIAPLNELVYCSLSNILSSWCQYEALKYVNFPTQILSKACKLLAVMLMSQVVNKKKYKKIEYVFAMLITTGMTFFLFGNQQLENEYLRKLHQTSHSTFTHGFLDGILILILYVTFDAFTSNWQNKIFDKYGISSLQMMAVTNFYSIGFTLVSLTETGTLMQSLKLVFNCTDLLRDCIVLTIFSAIGQIFVFRTISKFGALTFTTIMTLRQALAILLSCLIYKHNLSIVSIFGICLVFATLFYQIYYKMNAKTIKSKK